MLNKNARLLTVSRSIYPMYLEEGGSTSSGVCIQELGGGVGQSPPDSDSPGHVTCDACWEANPHPVDRQTPVKTLPCPKLRLRAVKKAF